ncbi:MAG: molybdopterin-guanine dinucleotide biosynthesis protein B [Magnetococcales bacterium]|nr:molybdopterin-guanine dinucleotide biosynthesis protein B [Magnetococcales bacterium]
MSATIIGLTAPSGTGKTTLLEAVIPLLAEAGLKVAVLKHGHHSVDPDTPGKDTHRFRAAGARTVLFQGPERWFMIQEDGEVDPEQLLARLEGHDIILIEGLRDRPHPKLILHRRGHSESRLDEGLKNIVAVVSDDSTLEAGYPVLDINRPDQVAAFIRDYHTSNARDTLS